MDTAGDVQFALLLWYVWSIEGLFASPILQQGMLVISSQSTNFALLSLRKTPSFMFLEEDFCF